MFMKIAYYCTGYKINRFIRLETRLFLIPLWMFRCDHWNIQRGILSYICDIYLIGPVLKLRVC